MIDIFNKNKINNAFTLAEVLITLGVIGVVAAMTMPTVIKNYKAIVLRSQLNKAYSSVSQATQMILTKEFDNNANMFENARGASVFIRNYYKKYLKTNDLLPATSSYGSYGTWIANNYKTYTGQKMSYDRISDTSISLDDGTWIIIDNGVYITIDINGWKKKPNKLGHDFFMFQIIDGALKPMGSSGTIWNICSKTSDSPYNGRGCTAQALADKDYFKNLP